MDYWIDGTMEVRRGGLTGECCLEELLMFVKGNNVGSSGIAPACLLEFSEAGREFWL